MAQIELMAEIYGTGIGEILIGSEKVYTPTTQQLSATQNVFGVQESDRVTIKLNPINPKNFLFDPNGTSVDDCMGVAIERYTSIHKIAKGIKDGIYRKVDIESSYKTDELEPTKELTTFQDEKVLLLTYYGLAPSAYFEDDEEDVSLLDKDYLKSDSGADLDDEYADMVESIIVICNGELLKAEKSPYMMKDRPVISYQDDTVPNRLLGRGTAEKAANMQAAIDAQMNAGGLAPAVSGIIKKYKRTLVNFQEDFLIPFINKCAWRRMQFDPERYPSVDVTFIPTATLGIIAREYEQEQLAFLIQTLGGNSPITPILMKGVLKNSSLSNREAMMQELDKASQPNPEQQQMEQQKVQMEMALMQAQITEIQSRGQANQANAQKTMQEAQLMPQTVGADIQKVQAQMQLAQIQADAQMRQEQTRSQNDMALINSQSQNDAQLKELEANLNSQAVADKQAMERYKIDTDSSTKTTISQMDNETKIIVANIAAQVSVATAQSNNTGVM